MPINSLKTFPVLPSPQYQPARFVSFAYNQNTTEPDLAPDADGKIIDLTLHVIAHGRATTCSRQHDGDDLLSHGAGDGQQWDSVFIRRIRDADILPDERAGRWMPLNWCSQHRL